MLARGYRGNPRSLQAFQIARIDVAAVAVLVVTAVVVYGVDRLLRG